MASATLHAMLWPRMPAGERIAAWVTWNLFFFWAPASKELAQTERGAKQFLACFLVRAAPLAPLTQLPHQRRRVSLHVILAVFLQSLHQRIDYRSLIACLQTFNERGGQQIARG